MNPLTTESINEWIDGYLITSDKTKMHVEQIHRWLSTQAYWCLNVPLETVQTAFDHSFCIGVLLDNEQVGFARLVTDYATFGYLADVYVTEPHRGKGLSKKMMEVLMNIEWVCKLRRISLATRDAHELYKQFGFTPLFQPERMMEIKRSDLYITPSAQ